MYKDKQGKPQITKKFYYIYLIYDAQTGQKLLEWTNKFVKDERNLDRMRVIGFLVNEKVDKKENAKMRERGEDSEYGNEEDHESSQEENSDDDE